MRIPSNFLVLALAVGLLGGVGGWFLGRTGAPPTPAITVAPDRPTALANGPGWVAEGLSQPDPLTVRSPVDLFAGYPAVNPDGSVNVVVEIPAGTNAKWEVEKDGVMRLEVRDGSPRVVKFLPYPGNYGMIPSTRLPKEAGGDGDALDVLILGPALPRGTVARARVIGVMKFLDRGEQDDKVLAVMDDTPFGRVRSLGELNETFPAAAEVVKLWFSNYKEPGKMEFRGWGEADEALGLVNLAATGR